MDRAFVFPSVSALRLREHGDREMNMMTRTLSLLAFATLAAASVRAGTLDEDEARVAALMRAELAAAPLPASGATVTFALAAAPAVPVIAEVIAQPAAPPPEPADDWLAPPARDQGLPFADLPGLLGRRVTIVTAGEHVHRGIVGAANAREVTLQVRRAGGSASYVLKRQQIVRIELR